MKWSNTLQYFLTVAHKGLGIIHEFWHPDIKKTRIILKDMLTMSDKGKSYVELFKKIYKSNALLSSYIHYYIIALFIQCTLYDC